MLLIFFDILGNFIFYIIVLYKLILIFMFVVELFEIFPEFRKVMLFAFNPLQKMGKKLFNKKFEVLEILFWLVLTFMILIPAIFELFSIY